MSGDGRLTITIPAGAVAADTQFGVQPISATAPGAFSAYRLTPEGKNFAQPLTLTFKYSPEEGQATVADTLRVATQTARGTWDVAAATHDANQRTLAVQASHFSDWSHLGGLQLRPATGRVRVGKSIDLTILICDTAQGDDSNAPSQLRGCLSSEHLRNDPRFQGYKWAANGIDGGNSAVGTVAGSTVGTYTAPAQVPASNPVAVSLELQVDGRKTLLVSNVEVVNVVPVYEGAFNGKLTLPTIQGETAWHEVSSTVRFTFDRELASQREYLASGTLHVRAKPYGCDEAQQTAAIEQGTLHLITDGPLAGTYQLNIGSVVTLTASCGNPREVTTLRYPAAIGAAGTDICPALRVGPDPTVLSGRWFCRDPSGATFEGHWTLREAN
jgi:hypothetical protein